MADFSKKAETGRIRVTLIFYLVLAITGMFILNPLYGAAAMAGAFFDLRLVLSDGNEEFWRDQRRSGRLVSEQLRACYAALYGGGSSHRREAWMR